jgi:hypothetical protein
VIAKDSAFLIVEVKKMIEGYATIKEIAEQWGITPRRVQGFAIERKFMEQ